MSVTKARLTGLSALIVLGLGACASVLPAAAPPAPSVAAVPPMDDTVRLRLRPQVEALLDRMLAEGRGLSIDGQPVFNGRDKFLPGKIAIAMAYRVLDPTSTPAELQADLAAFRQVADLTLQDDNTEWGIYYYLLALQKLNERGLLDRAVSPETLERLKAKLDWRTFVDERSLELINLPNNYYGVAYSVAELRALLGWESEAASQALLERTLAHYRTYSDFGFADETDGQGRFDRYSVLLIGEIAQRFIETGREPPPDVKRWLRQSAELLLLRVGPDGHGFEYGRSIGAYGETAFLEVLSAAAWYDLLTPEEKDVAYAYSARVAQRYMDFWVDPRTGSVNLWDGGRKTDAYRGKHRVLGENLSLARHFYYTNDLWTRMGYGGRAPAVDLVAWRASRPRATLTRFSRKPEAEHALFTWIDRGRLFGVPLINGGRGQHANNPYSPLPFSPGLVEGAADESFPQLRFQFRMSDGAVLAPLAYFDDVRTASNGDADALEWRLTAFDRLGEEAPVRDERLRADGRYRFTPGRIDREDRIEVAPGASVEAVEFEFASFAPGRVERVGDRWIATYDDPTLLSLEVVGADRCTLGPPPSPAYAAPTAAFRSLLRCEGAPAPGLRTLTPGWTLRYR